MGSFLDSLTRLDAKRLQTSVKATIQSNGRLAFTVEASKIMSLSDEKSLVVLAAANGDLGAFLSHKGDEEAFALKKCGTYFYLTFKNYLQEQGIDYKTKRVIYDITMTDEMVNNSPVYKFERRIVDRSAKDDDEALDDVSSETDTDASTQSQQEATLESQNETVNAEAEVATTAETTSASPEEVNTGDVSSQAAESLPVESAAH